MLPSSHTCNRHAIDTQKHALHGMHPECSRINPHLTLSPSPSVCLSVHHNQLTNQPPPHTLSVSVSVCLSICSPQSAHESTPTSHSLRLRLSVYLFTTIRRRQAHSVCRLCAERRNRRVRTWCAVGDKRGDGVLINSHPSTTTQPGASDSPSHSVRCAISLASR
jgi:hypothetical protein